MPITAARLWLALAGLLPLGACQAPPHGAVATNDPLSPVGDVGYLIFASPITPQTERFFTQDLQALQAHGARTIRIGMASPGGDTASAESMAHTLDGLRAAGVTIQAYNLGLVGSAATLVYLAAQNRYTAPRSAFLFHAAFATPNGGSLTAEQMRALAARLDAYGAIVKASLTQHTHLTPDQANTYVSRTVLLGPDDAVHDGVADSVAPFAVPPNTQILMIRPAPTPKPATPPPA